MKGFKDNLLDERLYGLAVNGRSIATVTLLAGNEKEFAYGYLLTEGIAKPEEIESVMVEGTDIGVLTKDTCKVLLPKKSIVSGCGGTASYLDPERLPDLETTINPPDISYKFTSPVLEFGGFSAAVIGKDKTVEADDLSQTGAIDKAIGVAVTSGINIQEAVLALSGKVTGDIVRKVLHAGISVIFSVYPPTYFAQKTADAKKLKLVKI